MPAAVRKRPRPDKLGLSLKLYVAGANGKSQRAIRNLKAICEQHVPGNYEPEVVDLYQYPSRLEMRMC